LLWRHRCSYLEAVDPTTDRTEACADVAPVRGKGSDDWPMRRHRIHQVRAPLLSTRAVNLALFLGIRGQRGLHGRTRGWLIIRARARFDFTAHLPDLSLGTHLAGGADKKAASPFGGHTTQILRSMADFPTCKITASAEPIVQLALHTDRCELSPTAARRGKH
jgi:hypothetical protein